MQAEIENISFFYRGESFVTAMDKTYQLLEPLMSSDQQKKMLSDFNQFKKRGHLLVLNTFAGGIIFLREPETILWIKVDFFFSR